MKKTFVLALLVLFSVVNGRSQNSNVKNLESSRVSFFSGTPVEDIEAVSAKMKGRLDVQRRVFAFIIPNTSFEFKNKLMQEHFNEKYMESDKYPESTFAGKLNDAVDLSKNGEYTTTATGKLKIHGVEKERTMPVKITVKDGKINVTTNFKVKVADHNIEIPTLVVAKIAEEIDVKVNALF